jgi:hypothetical protein
MDWPGDGSPLHIEELVNALRQAICFAYDFKRRNEGRTIRWTGPELIGPELAHRANIRTTLLAQNLKYAEEDQGRDALTTLLEIAVALGIEQGRRITMTDTVYRTMVIQNVLANLIVGKYKDEQRVSQATQAET